jgi:hypothetical protein
MNKQQFVDVRGVLVQNLPGDNSIEQINSILGIDIRNPTDVAKLLAPMKFGEVGLKFEDGVAVVTLAGKEGKHSSQHVALLRAMVAAVEAQALDKQFPEQKAKNNEGTKTPDGRTRIAERR